MARTVPSLSDYFARWQKQHNAPDVSPADTTALRLFLTFTYVCAKPFARRNVPPDAVTALGFVGAVLVVATVGISPFVAAGLIVVSTVTDGVDGCVAALTDRATRFGFVLDSVVDRFSDVLFLWALVLAGGSAPLGVAAGCATFALEYTRARAGAAGIGAVGVITVGERPTRVIAAVLGLVGSGTLSSRPWIGPNIGLGVTVVAAAVGLVQLTRWLRLNLTDPGT